MDRQAAAAAAKRLFAFFPQQTAATDPEIFLTGVVAVLELYPADIVEQLIDPRVGLPSKHPFVPSIAEIKSACDLGMLPRKLAEQQKVAQAQAQAQELELEAASAAENARAERKRIALCHLWLRAKDIGDPKASSKLEQFTSLEIASALDMPMAEATEFWPEAGDRLSKPIDQYGPLR